MIFFDDITAYLHKAGKTLPENERVRLAREGFDALFHRSEFGAVAIPLCYFLITTLLSVEGAVPIAGYIMGVVLAGFAGLRIYALQQLRIVAVENKTGRWFKIIVFSCLAMAFISGTLPLYEKYLSNNVIPAVGGCVLVAGVGAGIVFQFFVARTFSLICLLVLLLPTLIGSAIAPQEMAFLAGGLVLWTSLLVTQLFRLHEFYWQKTLHNHVLEKEKEQLVESYRVMRQSQQDFKQHISQVQEEYKKLRELFDSTPKAMIVCSQRGVILELNRIMENMLCCNREQALRLGFGQLFEFQEEEEKRLIEKWKRTIKGFDTTIDCHLHRPCDHRLFIVHVELRRMIWLEKPVILVIISELSEEELKQRADPLLQNAELRREYLFAALKQIDLPIYCKDFQQRYITVNQAFEKFCNLSFDEVRGREDAEIFAEATAIFFGRDNEVVKAGGTVELEGTVCIGGEDRNILLHKFPLRDDHGQVYATAGVCTDVTIMKDAFKAVQLANQAKSEFLAGMSHELRSPMHTILSFARLGLKRVNNAAPEKLATYFRMIITSGEKLLDLLTNLLDLSTLESAHAQYCLAEHDLARDLDEVAGEFQVIVEERNLSLICHTPQYACPALYDKMRIFQVVRNLLSNAIKFSPGGKTIRVELLHDWLEKSGSRRPAWKIMVIDEGEGLQEDELETVFNKFMQGAHNLGSGGVGLGLSICKRIIEDHHGIIWAEQNEKEGATFSFLIPALQ